MGVRRSFCGKAVLTAALLTLATTAPALAGQGFAQHSGQIHIRLVIPEPAALRRDEHGQPCVRQQPSAQPVEIQAEPQVHLASCSTSSDQRHAVRTAATSVQTYLIAPI